MIADKDPLSRLFDMHLAHGTGQLTLAKKLLELAAAERDRKRHDERLFGGNLSDSEREDAEAKFGAADDLTLKLRDEIKKLVEALIGVPFSAIEEANL